MLKQNTGDDNCIAAVAGMVTGTTMREFIQFHKSERAPYSIRQFCEYLLKKGFTCSLGIDGEQFYDEIDVADTESVKKPEIIKNPRELNPTTEVELKFRLGDYPALFIVKAETGKETIHAIYWDGKEIWDPNPGSANGRPLTDYDILFYYPIIKEEKPSE